MCDAELSLASRLYGADSIDQGPSQCSVFFESFGLWDTGNKKPPISKRLDWLVISSTWESVQIAAGMDAYISKPIDFTKSLQVIGDIIKQSATP